MSAVFVGVPRAVVEQAHKHFRETGRPWLYDPRPGEVRLNALPGDRCYMLALDIDHAAAFGLIDFAEGDTPEDRAAHLVLLLSDAVACILACEPIRFICEGRLVGRVEILESPLGPSTVRVRGHLSLTCLSWLLWEGRAGYHLALPAVLGEVPSATRRTLQRRSARRPTDG